MFFSCSGFESLDLSSFNASNITNMYCMFHKCNNLKEINGLIKFITNKVVDTSGMFFYCNKLQCLNLSNFDIQEMQQICMQCFKIVLN